MFDGRYFNFYNVYNIIYYIIQYTYVWTTRHDFILCIVCVQCARVSCGVHAVEPDEQLRVDDLVIVGGV